MAEFFERMNEAYKEKNFPNASILAKVGKNVKRNGIIAIVLLFGPIFLASTYGFFWAIGRTMELMAEGSEHTSFSIGICVFLGIVALLFLLFIVLTLRAGNKKPEAYYARSAKNSKLSENEIKNFEQQAFASDCYILKMTDGLDRVLSNNPHKDGFLTRDYVYLSDPWLTVFRIEDLRICCFEDSTYYLNNKKVHCLKIRLTASNGVTTLADTTKEAGLELMKLLTERNSVVDNFGGNVLKEGAYEEFCKRVLERK